MSDDTPTYEVSAQDVIDSLIEQRNAALNELARSNAALRALQRQRAGNGATPPEPGHDRPSGLPAQPGD
jgi:hypothetical protein